MFIEDPEQWRYQRLGVGQVWLQGAEVGGFAFNLLEIMETFLHLYFNSFLFIEKDFIVFFFLLCLSDCTGTWFRTPCCV